MIAAATAASDSSSRQIDNRNDDHFDAEVNSSITTWLPSRENKEANSEGITL